MRFAYALSYQAIKIHVQLVEIHVQIVKLSKSKLQPRKYIINHFLLQNDNKMTKSAKRGGRETLESGIVSKLQSHIVSRRNLSNVNHLFAFRIIANDYFIILVYSLTFTCVLESRGVLLVICYALKILWHIIATIHLLLMSLTFSLA